MSCSEKTWGRWGEGERITRKMRLRLAGETNMAVPNYKFITQAYNVTLPNSATTSAPNPDEQE